MHLRVRLAANGNENGEDESSGGDGSSGGGGSSDCAWHAEMINQDGCSNDDDCKYIFPSLVLPIPCLFGNDLIYVSMFVRC